MNPIQRQIETYLDGLTEEEKKKTLEAAFNRMLEFYIDLHRGEEDEQPSSN